MPDESIAAVAESLPLPARSSEAGDETDVEVLNTVPKQFCIDSEQAANWLVRRVIAAREYAEHVRAYADQELARAAREEKTLLFLFGRQIERWAHDQIVKLGGRRKSIRLPAGNLAFRKVNASLVVDDEAAVLLWAKSHCPSAVVVSEKLSRTEVKAHFEQHGELPDGTHVESERESFRIG